MDQGKKVESCRNLAEPLLHRHATSEEALMLESIRNRDVAISRVPAQAIFSAGTLLSFAWLLLQNKIHPIVVYLLQVYLTF